MYNHLFITYFIKITVFIIITLFILLKERDVAYRRRYNNEIEQLITAQKYCALRRSGYDGLDFYSEWTITG